MQQLSSPTTSSSATLKGSRPSTAEQRLRDLHGSLRARHASEHRAHFFGSGPLGLRPNSAVKPALDASDAQRMHTAFSATWSAASDAGGTQPAATDDAHHQHTMGRIMSKCAARAREQQELALKQREADRQLQIKLDEMPWWRRIVMDEAFRRRVATVAARALRTEEGFFRSDDDAQYIALPPLFRWEAMSADNRVVQPTPGAPCGPLDGVTHRWRGAFPPNGFVQLTPNVSNLRPVPEKKGPLHINVFVPTRGPSKPKKDDLLEAVLDSTDVADDEAYLLQQQSTLTIGQRVAAYEETRRRKVEEDIEARRLQREQMLGHANTRGNMAVDDAGCLTVDGVRLVQHYVGTIRPSFLLIRWRIICNALHMYAAANAGAHIGRGAVGGNDAAGNRSAVGGTSPRRNNGEGSNAAAMHTPTAPGTALQPTTTANEGHRGGGNVMPLIPVWLEGVPHSPMPVFRVETRPPLVTMLKDTDTKRIEAFPPDPLAFASIRREDISDARRQSLFQAPGCRKAVHRIFLQLPQDATGRLHQAAYVTFVLNLLNVFMPMFHTQSNIEVAEDEWLCRGTPEFPDFNIFYHNFFDLPLILSREKSTMTEDVYVAVWDLLFEALHGRDKLMAMYETDLQRSQHLLIIHQPTPSSGNNAAGAGDTFREGGPPTDARPQKWWWAYLPPYLDPTNEASQLHVPRRVNSDQYDLHLVAQQVKHSAPIIQQADPGRMAFIVHRLASAKLANRTAQASRVGSPDASFRGSARRRPQDNDAASLEHHNNSDDDASIGSPIIGGEDEFPSLAFQARKLMQRGDTQQPEHRQQQLSEKQREEARRINAMLSVENKASSLTLFEEVYETRDMERDEVDDMLDYLSEVSGSDVADVDSPGGEDDDDNAHTAKNNVDDDGGVLSESESAVHAARKKPKSIRRMYEEAKAAEHRRAEAEAAALAERRRVAATRRKSDTTKGRSNSLLGSARRTSVFGRSAGARESPSEAALDAADATLGTHGMHDETQHKALGPRPAAVIDVRRAEAIRSKERIRVRQLASGILARGDEWPKKGVNGGEKGGTCAPKPTTAEAGDGGRKSSPPSTTLLQVERRMQYRTFRDTHLRAGNTTQLDDPAQHDAADSAARQRTPPSAGDAVEQGDGGARRPLTTTALRPLTATSAHASVALNPFQRMSSSTMRLLATASSPSSASDRRRQPQGANSGLDTDPTIEDAPLPRRTAPSSATSSVLPSLVLSSSPCSTRPASTPHPSTFVPPSSYPPMSGSAAESRRRELLAALAEMECAATDEAVLLPEANVVDGVAGHSAVGSSDGRVRRPRMPSFMRHNNQTQARQQLGDLRTSVLSTTTGLATSPHQSSGHRPQSSGGTSNGVPPGRARPTPADPPLLDMTTRGASYEPEAVAAARRKTILASSGGLVVPPHHPTAAKSRYIGTPNECSPFQTQSASMQVVPIRPPKYRFPKFRGPAQPPDTLYVNGRMLHKQHPAMSLVQRIHLLGGGVQPAATVGDGLGATHNDDDDAATASVSPMSSPRPLGQGVPTPRTTLTALNRTVVIVVPTVSARSGSSRQQLTSTNTGGDEPLTVARMSIPSPP